MNSGKIVKKFFSKVEAENAATYQRAVAKKEGRAVLKVKVMNAYELYQVNDWFKANPFKVLGTPSMDQYMVVVFYNMNVVSLKKTTALRKKIVAAANTKTVAQKFKIIRLTDSQSQQVKAAFNFVSNTTVTGYRFKYRVRANDKKKNYRIALLPSSVYSY